MKPKVAAQEITINTRPRIPKRLLYLSPALVLLLAFQNCAKDGFSPLSQSENVSTESLPGSLSLAWDDNSESSLAGYKIYYGPSSNNYTNSVDVGRPQPNAGAVSYKITGLTSKETYYFAVTAYDSSHVESPSSNEISAQVP